MEVIGTDGKAIEFTIKRSSRRTIAIKIFKADGRIEVKAPFRLELEYILKFVLSKQNWINNHKKEIVVKPKYVDGSKTLLLGKEYTLNIVIAQKQSVEEVGDRIIARVKRVENTEKLLKQWYLIKAYKIIPPIIANPIIAFSREYDKSPSDIEIKFVRSYWGVCTQDMIIRLNAELVKAKAEHIEYIMYHELCHLIQRNHSPKFYALLDKVCPQWRDRKRELAELVKIG